MGQAQAGFFLSLILVLSCAGCAVAPAQRAPAQHAPAPAFASATEVRVAAMPSATLAQPSATVRASPTRTAMPTATPTPTSTPTPLPTSTPTTTPVAGFMSRPEADQKPQPDAMAPTRKAVVPILMYHYISVPPDKNDRIRLDLSVTPANFDDQLNYLATYSYTTVSLYDVYDYLATGASLPPRPIVLTFDDGYRDAYENAFPLLRKYHMTGTFFVISDFSSSGNPAYMDWAMIQEMSSAGMSIESHTRSHPDLRNRPNDFLVYQILGPIEAISAYTGRRPHFFCYPSGRYDDAAIRVLASADTWAAVTTQYGTAHTLVGAMTWTRVRIHGSTTLPEFTYLVKSG